MQEDKTLKKLLQEFGTQETSSSFVDDVMQKINTVAVADQSSVLLNTSIINLLKFIFAIIVVLLVVCAVFVPIKNIPLPFVINISDSVYRQLFSFIIVFWIGMIVNLRINKKYI